MHAAAYVAGRLAGLIVVLAGLVWLMLRVMPSDLLADLPLRPARFRLWCHDHHVSEFGHFFVYTYVAVFSPGQIACSDAMPLPRQHRLALYMYSFVPVTLGIVTISVPVCYRYLVRI